MGEVEVYALQGVDLVLRPGELLVILGPSGSGESTLLNLIGGLDVPTSGTLRYADHDLTAASERELTRYRREHVGFVFQFFHLLPELSGEANVLLAGRVRGARPDAATRGQALIDRLVVSGHPSTPGFNDPGYPIEGRRARTDGQAR